jgi:heme-degrading monooxygenase HmoA
VAGGGGGEGPDLTDGQVVTVFRSRRRPDPESEAGYRRLAAEMEAAARAAPGFVDFARFEAADGEHVSLVTFATPADQRAWRDDPHHRQAQRQGRATFYLEYSVQVGTCTHVSRWARGTD